MTQNLILISVIASALVSGVFMAFSGFVMPSLNATERAGSIQAMQIINRKVFPTLFMVLLIGMSALSLFMLWLAYSQLTGAALWLVIAGALAYFIGVFVATMVGNVPMNVALDKIDHTTSSSAQFWADTFYPKWVFWNYVRTYFAALAAVLFLLAL